MSDSSLEIDGHLAQLSVSSDHPITFQGISCVVASHIDSIFIWTTTMFSKEMLEALQSVTGSVTFCGNRHMHMNRKWQQRYAIHQPTVGVIRVLSEGIDTGAFHISISRVDVALDLITSSYWDAVELKEYFDVHHVMPWHLNNHIAYFYDTMYLGPRTAARNAIHYVKRCRNDDGSEHDRARVEMRLSGQRILRSKKLTTLPDIQDFNHPEFWRHNLRLVELDVERLGKVMSRRTRRRKPWKTGRKGFQINEFRYRGEIALRGCRISGHHDTPLQAVIDRYRKRYPLLRTAFRSVDISVLLDTLV